MKVLLLEDDMILSEVIGEYLEALDCDVFYAYDGLEAESVALSQRFDLFLLDVNVPGLDGLTFLRELRQAENHTPAIFITSLESAEDVAAGFGAGADDYLKKPFDLLELKARIDNLKRRYHIEDSDEVEIDDRLRYSYAHQMLLKEGIEVRLSRKEAQVLEYFLRHPGSVLSFDEILNNVWSYEDTPSPATLRTYIKNLRKHLGEEAITNIKGVGYRFH
ncbi:MAG: DNA-binding response regulator [Sulfurospirillum sp.]|nr:MAG: DNA-binding response regulator [Sulfurospirillum sp.]